MHVSCVCMNTIDHLVASVSASPELTMVYMFQLLVDKGSGVVLRTPYPSLYW